VVSRSWDVLAAKHLGYQSDARIETTTFPCLDIPGWIRPKEISVMKL